MNSINQIKSKVRIYIITKCIYVQRYTNLIDVSRYLFQKSWYKMKMFLPKSLSTAFIS